MICVYGRADPAAIIIRIPLTFCSTIQPNTNSTFCQLFGAEQNTNRIIGTAILISHEMKHLDYESCASCYEFVTGHIFMTDCMCINCILKLAFTDNILYHSNLWFHSIHCTEKNWFTWKQYHHLLSTHHNHVLFYQFCQQEVEYAFHRGRLACVVCSPY